MPHPRTQLSQAPKPRIRRTLARPKSQGPKRRPRLPPLQPRLETRRPNASRPRHPPIHGWTNRALQHEAGTPKLQRQKGRSQQTMMTHSFGTYRLSAPLWAKGRAGKVVHRVDRRWGRGWHTVCGTAINDAPALNDPDEGKPLCVKCVARDDSL